MQPRGKNTFQVEQKTLSSALSHIITLFFLKNRTIVKHNITYTVFPLLNTYSL